MPPERPFVAIVAGKELDGYGGHASLVRAHALAAGRAGFAVEVFCAARRSSDEPLDATILHRVAAPMPRGHTAELAHRPFLARAVARVAAERRPRGPVIVHSVGPWAGTAVAASRMLARRGIPAVAVASAYTTHAHERRAMVRGTRGYSLVAMLAQRRRYLWVLLAGGAIELRGYRRAKLVVASYESVRALLAQAGIAVRLAPYATPAAFAEDAARLEDAGASARSGAPLIVAVARHDPRKGYDVLLPALARLAADGVPFRACLVGPGILLAEHRAQLARLGLSDRVTCPGYVEDVFDYLRRADVFVLPSTEEGSGSLAVLEALQAGVAIVASRCDGLPEDLSDGHDALLAEPGDAGALERALATLLADAALRRSLAAAGRRTFEERFSAQALTDALGEIYGELTAPPALRDAVAG
ncbi:MAG TPA: glycosyltransferase [Solirubrobacteraceae bacterium]|nr:glycosyltransferase [Solirubrobacteraceae bacterium]